MQNIGIVEAPFWLFASAGLLILPVRWSAIISVVHWAADSGPGDQNSGLPTYAFIMDVRDICSTEKCKEHI
jgi:hypothetical protein